MPTASVGGPPARSERSGFYVRGWVLAVVGVVVVLAAGFAVGFAIRRDHGGRERGPFGEHHGGGGHGFGVVIFLVLVALVITAIVFLVRHFAARRDVKTDAEALLAERFARGEIDETDYLSRRNALRS
jgi:putative membrane protein